MASKELVGGLLNLPAKKKKAQFHNYFRLPLDIKEQSWYRPGRELSRFSARQEEANAAIAAGND